MLPLPGASLLSLSPDEAVLAACTGATVRVYSTQQLLNGSTAELAALQLPARVLRLAWRPASPAAQVGRAARGRRRRDGRAGLGLAAGAPGGGRRLPAERGGVEPRRGAPGGGCRR